MNTIDRTQLIQDHLLKEKIDAIAEKWGYKAGLMGTAGLLIYRTYDVTELTAHEALKHICFLNELHDTFNITTTSRFGVVTMRLPEVN